MNCQKFREVIDSYLGDELLVETNHEVFHHLENCAACRQELAARRALRQSVRLAVKSSPEMQIDHAFALRLRGELSELVLQPAIWNKLRSAPLFNFKLQAAAAVSILVISLLGGALLNRYRASDENAVVNNDQVNNPVIKRTSEELAMNQAVQVAWQEMAETAVGDHENCALEFRLAEKPISLDEAAKKYGTYNRDIEKVLISALQNKEQDNTIEAELLKAHFCVFAGRRFTHIVLRANGEIVSVLVTDSDLPAGEIQTGKQDGNLNVAGVNIGRFAIFAVSKLPDNENKTIVATVSPAIRKHIEQSS